MWITIFHKCLTTHLHYLPPVCVLHWIHLPKTVFIMALPPVREVTWKIPWTTCSPPGVPTCAPTKHHVSPNPLQLECCVRIGLPQVYVIWKSSLEDSAFLPFLAIWFNRWQVRRQKSWSDCFLPGQLSPYTPSFPDSTLAALPRIPLKMHCFCSTPAHFTLYPSHAKLTLGTKVQRTFSAGSRSCTFCSLSGMFSCSSFRWFLLTHHLSL